MRFAAVLIAAALVLGGCETSPYVVGAMIPGRITSLADGRTLPMQIQLSYGSGRMTAVDPKTSEMFDGTYTAIQQTQVTQHTQPSLFGDEDVGQSVATSDVAQASAVLVGNKGTILNIKMQIKAGSPPIGFGEAEDNHGAKYNVQF